MKLADFFAAIAPFLEGRASHAEAVRVLYPEANLSQPLDPKQLDARRLALYGRFCRLHRFEALDGTFAQTRAALIRAAGEPLWDALVGDYFRAVPMHHAELNENGSELPAFLLRETPARGLLPWFAELADLEWWSFRTRVAPDAPRDAEPDAGPLRLGSTVELRPYAHDLPGWLEAREALEGAPGRDDLRANDLAAAGDAAPLAAPDARACVTIFWRDRELDTRFAEASPLELAILHALFEGRPLSTAATRAGATAAELEETLADLRGAGIVLGAP